MSGKGQRAKGKIQYEETTENLRLSGLQGHRVVETTKTTTHAPK